MRADVTTKDHCLLCLIHASIAARQICEGLCGRQTSRKGDLALSQKSHLTLEWLARPADRQRNPWLPLLMLQHLNVLHCFGRLGSSAVSCLNR